MIISWFMSLQSKIEKIVPKDKLMPFCIGLLLAQLAYLSLWFIVLPLFVGVVKELYDKYIRKTGFNWLDLLATVFGIMPVLVIILFR